MILTQDEGNRLQPCLLARQRLLDALTKTAASNAITIVAAPMGYGKTIAAKALAESMGDRAFYFDIPPQPHDRRRLWDSFCTQLEMHRMPVAAHSRQPDAREEMPYLDRILLVKADDAKPLICILDNSHRLSPSDIDNISIALGKTPSPALHLVMFSQTPPAIKSGKGVALFDEEFLRFTRDEARWYFELHGITSADAWIVAWEKSEGWPAAMTLSLKNWRDTGDFQCLPDIESSLARSVLSGFSNAEQFALMRLSVMKTFTTEDIRTLGGRKACSQLQRFCAANAIVVHNPATKRYRFHRLVQDFLSRKLATADNINLPALCRHAGECHVKRGELLDAFRLFLRAGQDRDQVRALALFLMSGAEDMFASAHDEIHTAVQTFTWRIRAKHPLGYLAFIRLYLSAGGEVNTAALRLLEAEAYFSKSGSVVQESLPRLKGEMAVISGLLAFNDMESMWQKHDAANALLRGASRIHPQLLTWGFGSPHLSFVCLRKGERFRQLAKDAAEAEEALTALTGGHGSGSAKIIQMEYYLESGRLDTLRHSLMPFEDSGKDRGRLMPAIHHHFIQARLLVAEGETENAVKTLMALRHPVIRSEQPRILESLNLALDYVNACSGGIEQVSEWIRDGKILASPHGPIQRYPLLLVIHAKTLLLSGEYGRLGTVARNMPHLFMGYGGVLGNIHAKIFEGISLHRLQGKRSALGALRAAVNLSRADDLVFAFAEYGDLLTPLLRDLVKEEPDDPHARRILTFSETIRSHYVPGASGPGAALTVREEEIMRLMMKGMTNFEIGRELGISGGTVKKALAIVYEKLGASNRTQASRSFMPQHGR